MEFLKKHYAALGTILFDLFLLWVILRFKLGGCEQAVRYFSQGLSVSVFVTICIVVLTLYKSDFRADIPLFLAALVLGYWVEWWGTTRGVWAYVSRQTPPIGPVLFWGICLVTVYHLHLVFRRKEEATEEQSKRTWPTALILCAVVGIALAFAGKGLMRLYWAKHFDLHSVAAVIVGAFLILKGFDPIETLCIFLIGAGLGGLLEYLSTSEGGYRYVTGEGMPLFVPLAWGVICVAMVKLGYLIREGFRLGLSFSTSRR